EGLIARDEVRLAVDFDDGARASLGGGPHQALGGDAPGLLRRSGQAFLAQPIDRLLQVARDLRERSLAIHHARAGLLAQFLDERSGDLGHNSLSPIFPTYMCVAMSAWRSRRPDDNERRYEAWYPWQTGASGFRSRLRGRRRRRRRGLFLRQRLHWRCGLRSDVGPGAREFGLQPIEHGMRHQIAIEVDRAHGVVVA